MNCKNCKTDIAENSRFCTDCGAKVITDRITVRRLLSDVSENIFGWDNKFFMTIRNMIVSPQSLLKEYITGTRKKYMNPFTFLALGSAISLFIFNFYSEEYLAINIESNKQTTEMMSNVLSKQYGDKFDAEKFKRDQLEYITNYSKFMLKYFNLLVLLLMPLYTLLAKLVFGKPYNYAEHLVINSYIQGVTFWFTAILFVISIYVSPSLIILAVLISMFFYLFAYGKLYNLTAAEAILKFFKFIALLIGAALIFFILTILITIAIKLTISKFNL